MLPAWSARALVSMTEAADEARIRAEETANDSTAQAPSLLQDTARDELERLQEENNDLRTSYGQLQDIRAGEQAAVRETVAGLQRQAESERWGHGCGGRVVQLGR